MRVEHVEAWKKGPLFIIAWCEPSRLLFSGRVGSSTHCLSQSTVVNWMEEILRLMELSALWFKRWHESDQYVTKCDEQIFVSYYLCCQGLLLGSLWHCVAPHELQMALLTTVGLGLKPDRHYRCAPGVYRMLKACNSRPGANRAFLSLIGNRLLEDYFILFCLCRHKTISQNQILSSQSLLHSFATADVRRNKCGALWLL